MGQRRCALVLMVHRPTVKVDVLVGVRTLREMVVVQRPTMGSANANRANANSSIQPNEGGSAASLRVKDDVVRAGAGIGRYISLPCFLAGSLWRRPDVRPPKRMITG